MKRKIAGLLSLTMILSSMSTGVFAEDKPDDITGAAGSAGVNAIDTAKYRVILPTNTALNYIVDPQGLAQLGNTGSQVIGDLSSGKGKVYSDKDVAIANRSSKDIKVTAEVTATDQTTSDTDKTVVNVVDDITDAAAKDKASVQLYVVADEADFSVAASGGTTYNAKLDGDTAVAADSDSYTVVTSTSKTTDDKTGYLIKNDSGTHKVSVPVVLKKADYVATSSTSGSTTSYSYDLDGNSIGGAVSFSIAGICTSNDKWDKAGTNLLAPSIAVTYKFADASETEITALADDSINIVSDGLTANGATKLQTSPIVLVNVTGATISKTDKKVSFTLFADDDDNAAVKTNWSDKAATVQSLTVDGTTKAGATISVADDGTISVAHDDLETVADKAEVVAKVLYDGKIYIAKLTVPETPADTAPSVTTSIVTMANSSDPVYVKTDFGTGDKAATAITKITYQNSSGSTVELASTNYRFEDEDGETDASVIRLSGSYVGSQYNANGFTSREYTVYFNDDDTTTASFTLKK